MALVVVVISTIGFSHSHCWRCNKKYEPVVSKSKRPREQRTVDADAGSSEFVKAKQGSGQTEATCATDPDDAECKELFERKKQRLEQFESERGHAFLICKKNSRPLERSVTRNGNMLKLCTRRCERHKKRPSVLIMSLLSVKINTGRWEQRHRAAAEQFTREQQRSLQASAAFQPLAVWEGTYGKQKLELRRPRTVLWRREAARSSVEAHCR